MPEAPGTKAKAAVLAAAGEPATAAAEAFLRRTSLRAGAAIVFHAVAERTGEPEHDVIPAHGVELFSAQIEQLKASHKLVPASRLAAAVRMRQRGDPFPLAITFDDDLPSHAGLTLELLERFGVTATFYLGGGGQPQWAWDLQAALNDGVGLPDPLSGFAGTAREARTAVEALGAEDSERFAARLRDVVAVEPSVLADADVARLAAAGHEIGFHTRSHRVLTQLPEDELRRELTEGRDELAMAAGAPVETVAYPFGIGDERVAEAARAAGYSSGFTVGPHAVTPASNPLCLPRIDAPYDPPGRLGWHVTRALLRALTAGSESGSASADARRAVVGDSAGRALRRVRTTPRVGSVDLGDLGTTEPVSPGFGFERGTPVDRHYIGRFLALHADAIRGRVLEISEDRYTREFGGDSVESVDVLHVEEGNPQATIVGDLTDAPHIPDASFDAVICTQTLLLIWDVPAAVATLRRVLAPGGTALVTVPGITRVCREEAESWGDYWRFTAQSARRLFEEAGFAAPGVATYGNVLTATAQLHGIVAEELDAADLDVHDPDFEVLIGVRAGA